MELGCKLADAYVVDEKESQRVTGLATCHVGHLWCIGRIDAFCPKSHGFDSRSSCHVGTLGKSFAFNCLWRFGVKFRHSIRAVSGAPLSSSGLEGAL